MTHSDQDLRGPGPDSAQGVEQKVVNLALQGGGSHGAFTWGVLDRFLEEERLKFEGVTATSASAVNAVVLADGLAAPWSEWAAVPAAISRRRFLAAMVSTRRAADAAGGLGRDPARPHVTEAAADPVRAELALGLLRLEAVPGRGDRLRLSEHHHLVDGRIAGNLVTRRKRLTGCHHSPLGWLCMGVTWEEDAFPPYSRSSNSDSARRAGASHGRERTAMPSASIAAIAGSAGMVAKRGRPVASTSRRKASLIPPSDTRFRTRPREPAGRATSSARSATRLAVRTPRTLASLTIRKVVQTEQRAARDVLEPGLAVDHDVAILLARPVEHVAQHVVGEAVAARAFRAAPSRSGRSPSARPGPPARAGRGIPASPCLSPCASLARALADPADGRAS